MCHFQQDMLYKVIIVISDISHTQLNIPLKLSFYVKFICLDHNLEKYICKTMAKTNNKGAINTWSSMTSMCRLSFYTSYWCTNSFFPCETVFHWKDWLVLLTNMFTNAWWLPCWDHMTSQTHFQLMNQFIMGKKYICEWSVSRAAFHIICYALSSLTSLCLIDSDVRHWLCYTSAHY